MTPRFPYPHRTVAEVDRIAADYAEGVRIKQIIWKHRIDGRTIYRIVREAGVQMRRQA